MEKFCHLPIGTLLKPTVTFLGQDFEAPPGLVQPEYPCANGDILHLYSLLQATNFTNEELGEKIKDFFPQLGDVNSKSIIRNLTKLTETRVKLRKYGKDSPKLKEFDFGQWGLKVSAA